MPHLPPPRASLCCWRSLIRSLKPNPQFTRSLVTVQRGPVQQLDLPPELPKQYWSQLPKRLRPDQGKREIKIHAPPPSAFETCKDPVKIVDDAQRTALDPNGARARLFDRRNPDGAKVGDILVATFKTGEPFSGIILSIRSRGIHTSVLLRNHLTRVAAEMSIKVFSPLVQSMEVAQRTPKRKRRRRIFYMRQPSHDTGSVQKTVDQYLRQRAALTGGKLGSQYGVRKGKK